MIRVDLHIHTLPNQYSDSDFEFSMDFLVEYVKKLSLDVIAITNHNMFDDRHYKEIVEHFDENEIDCVVLPGVEVNYDSGHMLVIASPDNYVRLYEQCLKLEELIVEKNSTISHEEFEGIFDNYKDYILIPHYEKRPKVPKQALRHFGNEIFLGEVSNAKKFEVVKKEGSTIAPVLFSDYRASEENYKDVFKENKPLMVRTTYLDFTYSSFENFKYNMKFKDKIFSNSKMDDDLIEIDSNGTLASNKINLILGKRSTGKTFLLERINESMKNQKEKSNQVKFIEQFEITKNSEEKIFENNLDDETQEFTEEYLMPLKNLISFILPIDIESDLNDLDRYLLSLKDFAETTSLDNEFSKTAIYTEDKFYIARSNKLKAIIESLISLYNDNKYMEIVNRNITSDKFATIITDLIKEYRNEVMVTKLKEESNLIIKNLQSELSKHSSKDLIDNTNFSDLAKNIYAINKFNKNLDLFLKEEKLRDENVLHFRKVITRKPVNDGNILQKNILRTRTGVTRKMRRYLKDKNAYKYIKDLANAGIDVGDLYKVFVQIKTTILDSSGKKISGGQRAEYNLLKNIQDAQNYDYLLLDEPEGSFDNPFLKEAVIELIKEIGATTTVFVSTHNSTLGTLLNPNYILTTKFNFENFTAQKESSEYFEVYGNYFSQKKLLTYDGKEIDNYSVLIENMEAGETAYESKAELYKSLKD